MALAAALACSCGGCDRSAPPRPAIVVDATDEAKLPDDITPAQDPSRIVSASSKSAELPIEKLGDRLAAKVKIYRDEYGVPHIDGENDEAVVFGFAYAQAEDFFWQIEDSYILSLGRYSEVHGVKGLNSDLLNRTFEVVPRAQAFYGRLEPKLRALCAAFAAGLNLYLQKHPEVEPRLIKRFEPWHVIAFGRHMMLEHCFRYTRLSSSFLPRTHDLIWPATGSNGWAIGPSRTASGKAMLMVNPHLPWFGYAQLYEAHLRSGEGWSFIGAAMFGSPLPMMGHNEHLGWTFTTNEPDVADVWRMTFDDPAHPLNYRFGDTYRTATEWTETIGVKSAGKIHNRKYTLRKTHLGPIVRRNNDSEFLAVRLAGLEDAATIRESVKLVRASNLSEFKQALGAQQFPILNVLYADRAGNILFLYNGLIPRRDPQFDWSKPVDGSDPRTEWQGMHSLAELPQALNPASGYVQNCNSSPYTTCDEGSPRREDFPAYMAEDAGDDKRRAKRSRQILGAMQNTTFDEVCMAAFDTTVYWAQQELPDYGRRFEKLKSTDPELAARVQPYIEHLLSWDCRVTVDSTAATLCEAWYEELYGLGYPAEKLLAKYEDDDAMRFRALLTAASRISSMYGSWQTPWGSVFRIQRRENVSDMLALPFDDKADSLATAAAPGPMGVIFTQYSSPSLRIPLVKKLVRRYGLIGSTYLAVYEFGERIQGASVLNFGVSGDPNSPHYFDQAQLLAQQKLKIERFYWDDVLAGAQRIYRPGQPDEAAPASQTLR